LIVSINQQRAANERPLFLLFDQMYWTLTFGDHQHFDPVSICPEIRDYTVYIDGISKAFCATGVRVGWSMGPMDIIDKMKGILSHIGAWSPMAEQVATAQFLENEAAVEQHLKHFKSELW